MSILKIKSHLTLLALMLTSVALTGCNTLADAAKAKGTGEKVTYQASLDEMWRVLPYLIKATDLEIVSADPEKHLILAKHGGSSWSFGEKVAIFVDDAGPGKSTIEVVSKKVLATNVGAPNWAGHIFRLLDERFKRA